MDFLFFFWNVLVWSILWEASNDLVEADPRWSTATSLVILNGHASFLFILYGWSLIIRNPRNHIRPYHFTIMASEVPILDINRGATAVLKFFVWTTSLNGCFDLEPSRLLAIDWKFLTFFGCWFGWIWGQKIQPPLVASSPRAPLLMAAQDGYLEVVRHLLDAQAPWNDHMGMQDFSSRTSRYILNFTIWWDHMRPKDFLR